MFYCVQQKITKIGKEKIFGGQLLFADRKKGRKGHMVDTARPGGLKNYVQKDRIDSKSFAGARLRLNGVGLGPLRGDRLLLDVELGLLGGRSLGCDLVRSADSYLEAVRLGLGRDDLDGACK